MEKTNKKLKLYTLYKPNYGFLISVDHIYYTQETIRYAKAENAIFYTEAAIKLILNKMKEQPSVDFYKDVIITEITGFKTKEIKLEPLIEDPNATFDPSSA